MRQFYKVIVALGRQVNFILYLGAVVFSIFGSNPLLIAQTNPTFAYDTDGYINTSVATDNALYFGGKFSYFGPTTGAVAKIDPVTGNATAKLPQVDGIVNAIAPDGNGGWYVGGLFSSVNGKKSYNLAHINADFTLDEQWTPIANDKVCALQLVNNKLFVGGAFTLIGGLNRKYVACLDLKTGVPTVWSAKDINGAVNALAARRNILFIGGAFTRIGGQKKAHLAAIDTEKSEILNWTTEPNADVLALAINDNLLYIGGSFSKINDLPRNCIASLDIVTGRVSSWNPDLRGDFYDVEWRVEDYVAVEAIAVAGTNVYVGGEFTYISSEKRNQIASIDATTGKVTKWQTQIGGVVNALACANQIVYIGGEFSTIDGKARKNLYAIDAKTGRDAGWQAEAGGGVRSFFVESNGLMVGGEFHSAGGKSRHCLASVNLNSGLISDWNPNRDNDPALFTEALTLYPHKDLIYVGGKFSKIAGQARRGAAAVLQSNGAANYWNPDINGAVYAITADRKQVWLGGEFKEIGGQSRTNIAAVDHDYGRLTEWAAQANDTVRSLLLVKNQIYVGGAFTQIAGMDSRYLALLNARRGNIIAGNYQAIDLNGRPSVNALLIKGTMLFVGGKFSRMADRPCHNLTALNTRDLSYLDWSIPIDGEVFGLAANDADVFIGGSFSRVGDAERKSLASVDLITARVTFWNPEWQKLFVEPATIKSLLLLDNRLKVVGHSMGVKRRSWQSVFEWNFGEVK